MLALFIFLISLFVYVFPEVDVTIVPETEAVENDFEVMVDANLNKVDSNNSKFPGELIKVQGELSREFMTSGSKNIGEKAQGEVVFFNQTGLVQPLTTENSLVTDDGIVFFVTSNIEIPKAEVSAEGNIVYGNITANIIAREAGEEGNVQPGRLTVIDLPFSKQNKIYGEVKSKLTGGTSEVIQVVSEDDLKNAEKKIMDQLKPELRNKLIDRLANGQALDDNLIEYNVLKVEKAVELEEEVKKFEMTVVASAKALVWDVDEVRRIIMAKIENSNTSGKKLVKTSRDVFEVTVKDFDLEKGTAKLLIHTKNQISLPIDLDNIRDELRGLPEFEARRLLLSKDNIKDARFKFKYSLTSKIPDNGNRINLKLNFQ